MAWSYKREERSGFTPIAEGDYRIRIRSADKAVSKSGRDMLALQFDVSGSNQILYHYIVFLDDRPEITNRMLTQFFDSFKNIEEGDFNMRNWIGKVGACRVKHEDYNGSPSAKIHYFISSNKQSQLPPWKEPEGSDYKAPVKVDENGFMQASDGDYPPFGDYPPLF